VSAEPAAGQVAQIGGRIGLDVGVDEVAHGEPRKTYFNNLSFYEYETPCQHNPHDILISV
jgi:hypothetical protein